MPNADPVWLDADIVLELNRQVLRFSDETPGVRGGRALRPLPWRPKAQYLYSGIRSYPHLAAHYAEAITGKHVFRGGNKRTSLAAAAVFLRLNGLDIEATLPPTETSETFDDEAFKHIVALSTGEINAVAFGNWLASLARKQS
jgi:death-on-curing protein